MNDNNIVRQHVKALSTEESFAVTTPVQSNPQLEPPINSFNQTASKFQASDYSPPSTTTLAVNALLDATMDDAAPAVEEISCHSTDQVTAQEIRQRCPSSCKKTMNKGHRLDSSVDNTFSEVPPGNPDTMNLDTLARDRFAKTNTGDEEGDTQLCSTLPGSEISEEELGWTSTRAT